jgi:hypothetical protein
MITPILEDLLLKRKATRHQITIGDGPLSVLPVPPGKTIIITDIDIIPSINAPGTNIDDAFRLSLDCLANMYRLGLICDWGQPGDILNEIFKNLQFLVSRSCVQLIEQSANLNNTYTCAPNLHINTDLNVAGDPASNTVFSYPSVLTNYSTKNTQFNTFSIHTQDISFRWAYPYAVDPNAGTTPVLNNVRVEPIVYSFVNSFIRNSLFEYNMPQGLVNTAIQILVTAFYAYPTTALGAWVPIGTSALSQDGINTLTNYNGFNFIRYSIFPDGVSILDNNLANHTVCYGNTADVTASQDQFFDSIFEYIGKPKANIGYVVLTENLEK